MSVTEFNTPKAEHAELGMYGDIKNSTRMMTVNNPDVNSENSGFSIDDNEQSVYTYSASSTPNNSTNDITAINSGTTNTTLNPMTAMLSEDTAIMCNNNNKTNANTCTDNSTGLIENKKDMPSPPLSPETEFLCMSSQSRDGENDKDSRLSILDKLNNALGYPSSATTTTTTTTGISSSIPSPREGQYDVNGKEEQDHDADVDNSFDSIFLNSSATTVEEHGVEKISSGKPLVMDLEWSNANYNKEYYQFISKYRNYENIQNDKRMMRYNKLQDGAEGSRRYYTRSIDGDNESGYGMDSLGYYDVDSLSKSLSPRGYRTRLRVTAQHEPVQNNDSNTKKRGNFEGVKKPMVSKPTVSKPRQHHVHHQPSNEWKLLPDYSPPLSTLSNLNKSAMKVEWKGSTMDLSHDPLMSKLHPAELQLASILRLTCDSYLDSKRRLFMEKVNKLKRGSLFRRTDAQKACRVDVNKASRLYQAFEKVGWLDDKYFRQFL